MPWFRRVHPGHFIVPPDCEDIDDAMWVAHMVERPIEDVINDPRLKNTRGLKPTRRRYVETSSGVKMTHQPIEMITLYEIRDRKWERVIIISPDHAEVLYEGPDDLQTAKHFCLFPLIFNNDDEVFWGVPDSVIIEPQQLEINEIRTQMMKHRRLTLVKIISEIGVVSEAEKQKMLSEAVAAFVEVKDVNKVKPMQVAGIPDDLVLSAEYVRADMREVVGFSRNQLGEFQPKSGDTTATEASIVQMASEVRVDERRDIVSDLCIDIVEAMHEVIFKHWHGEQVVDIAGPGGVRLWVAFTSEMLKGGAYEVRIDSASAMPETKVRREQRAIQVYSMLKENPLIDPVKLTRYLLRELHGVQYDDLMRGLPQGAGLERPMNIAEYTQVIANAQNLGLPMPGGEDATLRIPMQ